MTEEIHFSKLFSGSIQYQYTDSSYNRQSYSFKFPAIEKLVNPDLNYKEREELLLTNAKINSLKKQNSDLENSKIEIRKSKLSNLISDELISISQKSDKQSELINILLRNGYIDENYLDYISIFYEGSLSKADYQFLINVKIQRPSEFDFKLTKTEKLIEKISLFDFEKEYILNFDLVEFLQQKPNDFDKKKRLFKHLSNQSPSSIRFINGFIEITTDLKTFIQNLCEYWQNIWIYIESESLFDDAKKNDYFIRIIRYAKIEDIKSIFSSHHNYLNTRADFLQIADNEKRLKKIIEKLDLKFDKINSDSPTELIDYVYKGAYYDLNMVMIEMLLKHYNKFDLDKFSTANFSSILTSSLDSMIDYIGLNIEAYINSVYLKIETNIEEPIEFYLKILNNEILDIDLKEKIINHVNTKIIDIKTISDTGLWNTLFKYSKVTPSWVNILASFESEEIGFSEDLIGFLNIIYNAEQLSKIKMPTKVNDINIFGDLALSIIAETEITDESYNLITISIPWCYSDLDYGNITEKRVKILINNNKINPTIESFNKIKESHEGLNIHLLEKFPGKYIEKIDELEINDHDLELILKSSSLSISEKKVLFNNCDEETINSNDKVLLLLSDFLIQKIDFNIKNSTIKKILLSVFIAKYNRIKIFNQNLSIVDSEFIKSFIGTLGNEYYDIIDYDRKATLTDNSLNKEFLENLVSIQFLSSFSETKKGLRVNHKRK